MRILICGEGKHELGDERWCPRQENYIRSEGWTQPLLKNIAQSSSDIELYTINRRQFAKHKVPKKHHFYGEAHKCYQALNYAERNGYNVLIYVMDADTNKTTEFNSKLIEMNNAWSQHRFSANAVACVPMSMSESWLLADQEVWRQLGLDDLSSLPSHPEHLWGDKRNPLSDYPKNLFERICRECSMTPDHFSRYWVMSLVHINTLYRKCPKSFGVFYNHVSSVGL